MLQRYLAVGPPRASIAALHELEHHTVGITHRDDGFTEARLGTVEDHVARRQPLDPEVARAGRDRKRAAFDLPRAVAPAQRRGAPWKDCLLYTSDAADE